MENKSHIFIEFLRVTISEVTISKGDYIEPRYTVDILNFRHNQIIALPYFQKSPEEIIDKILNYKQ